jgi:putative ABC transport system permease protein
MIVLHQFLALLQMNMLAARVRLGGSLVIVFGLAAVVGVTISILSLSLGLIHSFDTYARADRVVVRGGNTDSENGSRITHAAALQIGDIMGIKKGSDGQPMAAAEARFFIPVVYKASKLENALLIRGTTPRLLEFRPELRMVEGRMFTAGLREMIVGRDVAEQAEGMTVGDQTSQQRVDDRRNL